MRNGIIMLVAVLLAFGAFGQSAPSSTVSQLPDGLMSKGIYLNDALGVRLKIPKGWTGSVAPKDLPDLDERNADGPVNRCSKILFSMQKPPSKKEDRLTSLEVVFALDPACFPGEEFPDPTQDRSEIQKFTKYLYRAFGGTPFISHQSGADMSFSEPEGRFVVIFLTGESIINGIADSQSITGKPLHVNTLLGMAKSKGYWVAWGVMADDRAKEQLMKSSLQIWVQP